MWYGLEPDKMRDNILLELSRKTIAAKLKTLKEKKMIERVGASRKGYWKIL